MADETTVKQLLDGAVDTHMHTRPDVFDRHESDFEAARAAKDAGMRAIGIKSHHFETGSRAQLVNEELPSGADFDVIGGITLNEWVGGLNARAVDGAANLGADIVWMPTITARYHVENWGYLPHLEDQAATSDDGGPAGITVFDDDGDLSQDTLDVLDAIADNDLVLALSHLSPEESFAVVREGRERGVEDYMLTHPHAAFLDYSHDEMREMADLGVTLEIHYAFTTELTGPAATIDDFAETVDEVGPEHIVMATDGGAVENPTAMAMFEAFVTEMLDAGVPENDIATMVKTNPRELFDLD
jgi:predicted TIM-barrel fold metal-dependent hydrolase